MPRLKYCYQNSGHGSLEILILIVTICAFLVLAIIHVSTGEACRAHATHVCDKNQNTMCVPIDLHPGIDVRKNLILLQRTTKANQPVHLHSMISASNLLRAKFQYSK